MTPPLLRPLLRKNATSHFPGPQAKSLSTLSLTPPFLIHKPSEGIRILSLQPLRLPSPHLGTPHPGVTHRTLAGGPPCPPEPSPPRCHFSLPEGSRITALLCSAPSRGSRVTTKSWQRSTGPAALPALPPDRSPPAPGPFHLQFPLPGTLFPETATWLPSRLLQVFARR